jgi:hypothetical protein
MSIESQMKTTKMIPDTNRYQQWLSLHLKKGATPAQGTAARAPAWSGGNVTSAEWRSIDQILSSAALLGGDADLGLMIYAMQIKQLDNQVADALKEIQQTSKLRECLSTRLNELRELKDIVQTTSSNDKDGCVSKNELREHFASIYKKEGMTDEAAYKQADKKVAELLKTAKQYDLRVNSQTGEVQEVPIKDLGQTAPPALKITNEVLAKVTGTLISLKKGDDFKSIGQVDHNCEKSVLGVTIDDGWRIDTNQIETEINRVKDQAAKLDSDRELKMITLNQQLNKKEQAVTQLTNMLKKTHDTKSAIIQNLK